MAEVIERNLQEWEDLKGSCHFLATDEGTDIGMFLHAGLWEHVMG